MKKLLGNIFKSNNFQSLLGHMLTILFSSVAIMILARYFSEKEFGIWSLYFACYFFTERLRIGFLNIGLVRNLAGEQDRQKKRELIGSAWSLGLVIIFMITLLVYGSYLVFHSWLDKTAFYLFFRYYPILGLLQLPFDLSQAVLMAGNRFKLVCLVMVATTVPFFLAVLLNVFFFKLGVDGLAVLHIIMFSLFAVFILGLNWGKVNTIICTSRKALRQLFHFGKYSTGTMIGTNILRNFDLFIIGIFLPETRVALYSVPLKFIDAVGVVIFSFSMVALPLMSEASKQNDVAKVRKLFYQYAGVLTLLFIPACLVFLLSGKYIIGLIGGMKYFHAPVSLHVYYIFLFYCLLLSLDRISGITLDSINKPGINFRRILIMLIVNIIGDVIAVVVFKSLEGVALVTVINTLVGVIAGLYLLKKEIGIKPGRIFSTGFRFVKSLAKLKYLLSDRE